MPNDGVALSSRSSQLPAGAPTDTDIAIIGAGVSGIILAIRLLETGHSSFTIYERDSGFGGTWLTNAYPGCRCDVPAHWYSFSRKLNPRWSETHPPQTEILAYWQALAKEYGLEKYTRFSTGFVNAKWDAGKKEYAIKLKPGVDVLTHVQEIARPGEDGLVEVRHRFLVSATGGFSQPLCPDIPGLPKLPYAKHYQSDDVSADATTKEKDGSGDLDKFEGLVVHAARYPREGLDLRGKKVAVLGNGCSGSQIVPSISNDSAVEVYPLVRSGQWYAPGMHRSLDPKFVDRLARWPLLLHVYRFLVYLRLEIIWWLIFPLRTALLRGTMEKTILKRMETLAPKECVPLLKPSFPLGGKRIINDTGYLTSLNRPNVHPITSRIERFTRNGLRTEDGKEQPLDIVILATGFDVPGGVLNVLNDKGESLRDQLTNPSNTPNGGPKAYHGISTPGFPNHYMLLGHNTAPAHGSVIYPIEVAVEYLVAHVGDMQRVGASWAEPDVEVTEDYNAWLDRRLENSVWSKTSSFYRLGPKRAGRIFTNWPGPVALYWLQNRHVRWGDWRGSPEVGKLAREQSSQRRRRLALWGATTVAVAAGAAHLLMSA